MKIRYMGFACVASIDCDKAGVIFSAEYALMYYFLINLFLQFQIKQNGFVLNLTFFVD